MALEDPIDPQMVWPPPQWLGVQTAEYTPAAGMMLPQPTPPPPPPPPPKDKQKIEGGPVTSPDEIKATPSDLVTSPDQIVEPQPKLTPAEEAQIQIDQPGPTGPGSELENPNAPYIGYPHAPGELQAPPALPNETALEQPPDVALQHEQAAGEPVPPPPPTADAISGAGAEAPPEAQNASDARVAYYLQHPDKLIEDQAQAESEGGRQFRTRLIDEIDKKQKQDDQDYQAYQTAMAQRQKEYMEAANTKIDPDQWWHSRSTGQTIAAYLSAALGGLAQQGNGGRNIGVEMINRAIDNDIQAQQANLTSRKSALSELIRVTGDNYTAQQRYRAGVWNNLATKLEAEAQNFDPEGTQARSMAMKILQARAQANAAAMAAGQQTFKNTVEAYKTVGEFRKNMADAAKFEAEAAKLAAKQGGGGGASVKVYGTVYPDLNAVATAAPKDLKNAFSLPGVNGEQGGFVIASSEDNAKSAQHLSNSYKQVDYDLNELERISEERNGAKSTGGTVWKKWQDTNEQHYEQLLIDLGNNYGLIIHGGTRPIPAGTLEEVMKVMPQLKSAVEGGDTTKLIEDMHNDVDNRTSALLSSFAGTKIEVHGNRPHVTEVNSNTLEAPLLAKPVQGAAGYARLDVKNVYDTLDGIATKYRDNPGLGGQASYVAQINQLALTQRQAAQQIQADTAKLEAVKKPTPAQKAQIVANRQALADRQEAVRAIENARGTNVTETPEKPGESRGDRYIKAATGAIRFLTPGAPDFEDLEKAKEKQQ